MIRFSIVTVVRNDPAGVIRTLQSVFSQTYPNYEVIVQDGASTDETSDVLRGFGDWIDSLTIEKDAGIYDAMNRALRRATGDYILFLNAADFFVDPHVLSTVAETIDVKQDDVFAGVSIADETGKPHQYRPDQQFWAGSTFDHQAAFIRASLMKDLEYDTRYKIAGDLHFFTRARKRGARFRYENIPIARKPFVVGASSDFIDRINDRASMLEEAWGDDYPVTALLRREVASNLQATFHLSSKAFDTGSLAQMLQMRETWVSQLSKGHPPVQTQAGW